MSIFDDISNRISSIGSDLSSQISSRVSTLGSSFSAAGAATSLLKSAVGRYVPQAYQSVSKALNGDYLGAGLSALAQTKLGAKANSLLSNSVISSLLFNSMANPLLGGITPSEAQQICAEVQATKYSKKNLFYLEIVDFFPDMGGALGLATGGFNFNLFATQLSFGPNTISGDSYAIGAAVVDNIHGSERVELRVTTYDDAAGSVKKWFQTRCDLMAHADGTFGVPKDYLVQVRILHAAINDDVMARFGGYEQKFIMRCGALENELSRSEDGLEEIQMTFVQFDTMMFDQT